MGEQALFLGNTGSWWQVRMSTCWARGIGALVKEGWGLASGGTPAPFREIHLGANHGNKRWAHPGGEISTLDCFSVGQDRWVGGFSWPQVGDPWEGDLDGDLGDACATPSAAAGGFASTGGGAASAGAAAAPPCQVWASSGRSG